MGKYFLSGIVLVLFIACGQQTGENKSQSVDTERLVQYVDPYIGTGYHGHTYPGPTTPFGMVQLSPNNGHSAWDWCSGYHYSDSILAGFTHMQLSGTGIGDLSDVLVLPCVGEVTENTEAEGNLFSKTYRHQYTHADEEVELGYYAINLKDAGIKAELTAASRVGFHRYTFPKTEKAHIIFDLGFEINWDKSMETSFEIIDDKTIRGVRKSKGWAAEQWVYFTAHFSQAFTGASLYAGGKLVTGSQVAGENTACVLHFDTRQEQVVQVKVGLSSAGHSGSDKSITEEVPHWNFDQLRQECVALWEEELQKIKITTKDDAVKRTFYTALYHSSVAPYTHSDKNHEYKAPNGQVKQTRGKQYTVFSLWDTFRALHPLFTITQGERVPEMIRSMMNHYEVTGLLPVWELVGNETNCMIGNHAIPVIVDAYFKGLCGDLDVEKLYEAVRKTATQEAHGLRLYQQYGYIPWELENESVSKALEYAYNDWCVAVLAKALKKEADYKAFLKRSMYYKNHFDASTGFMRGKDKHGKWKKDFNPLYSNHRKDEYVEGNAWQYTWFNLHDPQGLIRLYDSREAFNDKLTSLFTQSSVVEGAKKSPDISGMIGQYAHGNEPSHHTIYLFSYSGMPWKTQEYARQVLTTLYSDKPEGLCGNEDCGQMSAWYVFSAMGFYPFNPANGVYVLGSPVVDAAEISLSNGKSFEIKVKNNSKTNKYIQSVSLNGEPLSRLYFTHRELSAGGVLEIVMGDQPNKDLGIADVPPSLEVIQ